MQEMEDTKVIEPTEKPVSVMGLWTVGCRTIGVATAVKTQKSMSCYDSGLESPKFKHPVLPDPYAIWTLCRPRMPWWGRVCRSLRLETGDMGPGVRKFYKMNIYSV